MTDTVGSTVLFNGKQRYSIELRNTSDGTGETNVKKVDISTLVGPLGQGQAPTHVAIEKVQYAIQGFSSVLLSFDRTSDVNALVLPAGNGLKDFSKVYGLVDVGTGDTGDVLLTTRGAVNGATYDITLHLLLLA